MAFEAETLLSMESLWEHVITMMGGDPDSYPYNGGVEPAQGAVTKTGLGVGVELTRSQFKMAVKQALRIYRQYVIASRWKALSIVSGQTVYDLDSDFLEGGILELEEDISSSRWGILSAGFGEDFVMTDPSITFQYGYYHVFLQYYEQAKRVLSSDFYWEFNPTTSNPLAGKLYISPSPTATGTIGVKVCAHITTPEDVVYDDADWLFDAVLALCEIIVGRVRAKFSGQIPGQSSGAQVDTSFVDSGQSTMDRLRESLIARYGDAFLRPLLGSDY